jgi:hypothetical protein
MTAAMPVVHRKTARLHDVSQHIAERTGFAEGAPIS